MGDLDGLSIQGFQLKKESSPWIPRYRHGERHSTTTVSCWASAYARCRSISIWEEPCHVKRVGGHGRFVRTVAPGAIEMLRRGHSALLSMTLSLW